MFKGNSEVRMIWLMALIILGIGAWSLEIEALSVVCGFAFMISIMQYVKLFSQSVVNFSQQKDMPNVSFSQIPLYISSIIVIVSGLLGWLYILACSLFIWVYFLIKWLNCLEYSIKKLQEDLGSQDQLSVVASNVEQQQKNSEVIDSNLVKDSIYVEHPAESFVVSETKPLSVSSSTTVRQSSEQAPSSFIDQLQLWLFKGNPVLKAAIVILLIGIVLLLRFATEHWQISLAVKLGFIALISFAVVLIGWKFQEKNRGFALALEGLGLAGLFLTVFFAYYNQVIPNIYMASFCFAVVMTLTLYLSLKQQAVELAIMAMTVAYLAPFTLPVRQATAVELVAYYLLINIAVAVLTTLKPWKYLNQIAFLITVLFGGGYAIIHGTLEQRFELACLVLAHTAVFIWLGFRFSQLLAKEDLIKIQLKPVLDIALIFGAPIVGYCALYVMFFDEMYWRAGFSAIFALVFAVLYQVAKKNQFIPFIAQSYLSLMQIFLVLILPILLPDYWNVVGWALVGVGIFIYALYKNSNVSRYLSMGLLVIAGISAVESLINYSNVPNYIFWVLCLCYFTCVFVANFSNQFQKQFTLFFIAFLSFLMMVATSTLLLLLSDELSGPLAMAYTLLFSLMVYVVLNEILQRRHISWGWLLPKWLGLTPIHLFAYVLIYDSTNQGILVWASNAERIIVLLAGLLLASLWLRPLLGVKTEKEWVSMGALSALSLASLTFIPSFPYLTVVILPLIFCLWCYLRAANSAWKMFWQTRTTLVLMIVWMICSQLFSTQVFFLYVLPIFNPFDFVSLAMLLGFMWILMMQVKVGLDKGLASIMAVLSLLWLSSYIVLRALHVYLGTPIQQIAVWSNATIQLSFTLLWVVLAFIAMSIATRKRLKVLWLLGGSILIIVSLKLVLLDLSHIGTFTRVISFLGAGFVMLIIAYIAPMPDELKQNERIEK
jgi:uncharacterized membrane protein